MASITSPPQRIQLIKAVERAFEKDGWVVAPRPNDNHDFRVNARSLNFLIKCFDESRIDYDSPTTIVTRLDSYTRDLRTRYNRQLIVVFGRNFLGMPLESLMEREIFAIALDQLSLVTRLAEVSDDIPKTLNPRQLYLVTRCIEYTNFLSLRHRDAGNIVEAIAWARRTVEQTVGYSNAYFLLFSLLKKAQEFDAAAEVGETIMRYSPEDPRIIRGMADLAHRRGDAAEAERWTNVLTERPTTARTLDDILAKQRSQSDVTKPERALRSDATPKRSGILRLVSRPSFWFRPQNKSEPRD